MPFQKGNKLNKGYKQTEEHKKKIGLANAKIKLGVKQSKETIEKRKKKLAELKTWVGRKHTLESRLKMSKSREGRFRGEKSPSWQGGLTRTNKRIRHSFEYKLWRKSVLERDNFTCVFCKVRGGKLNADHIKPFALYPELRFAIDNGRTLCIGCHRTTDTYGGNSIKKSNPFN